MFVLTEPDGSATCRIVQALIREAGEQGVRGVPLGIRQRAAEPSGFSYARHRLSGAPFWGDSGGAPLLLCRAERNHVIMATATEKPTTDALTEATPTQAVTFDATAIHVYERGHYLKTIGDLSADQAVGYKAGHESRHPDRQLVIDTRQITATVPSVVGDAETYNDANGKYVAVAREVDLAADVPQHLGAETFATTVRIVHIMRDGKYKRTLPHVFDEAGGDEYVRRFNETSEGTGVAAVLTEHVVAGAVPATEGGSDAT